MVGDPVRSENLKLQLEESISTYRTGLTVLVQITTVLIVANVTVLGYALSQRSAGILLIGACFPLLIVFLLKMVGKLFIPAIFTAYCAEEQLGEQARVSLITTGLFVICSDDFMNRLAHIAATENPGSRVQALRSLEFSILGSRERMNLVVLFMFSALQIVAAAAFMRFFSWKFF